MTVKEALKSLGSGIGFLVVVAPQRMKNLLLKYGKTGENRGQMIKNAVDLATSNEDFFKDFQKLLAEVVVEIDKKSKGKFIQEVAKSKYVSMDGYANTTGGFWSGINIGSILDSGTQIYTTIKQTDSQKALAEAQAEAVATQTEGQLAVGQQQLAIEQLKLEQLKAQQSAPMDNKTLYLILGGVGLVVVAGIIIAVSKK